MTGPVATPALPSQGSLLSQAQAFRHKQACETYQATGFSRQAGGRATDSDTRSDSSCPARSTCWRASSSCSRALTSRSFRLSSCCWAVGYFWGRLERACRWQRSAQVGSRSWPPELGRRLHLETPRACLQVIKPCDSHQAPLVPDCPLLSATNACKVAEVGHGAQHLGQEQGFLGA